MIIGSVAAFYTCSNIQHRSSYYTNYCTRSSYYTMMELNAYFTEIKYYYLELLAFYFLIGLSEECFWDKGISNMSSIANRSVTKIGSNVHLPCTLACKQIINLRQTILHTQFECQNFKKNQELGLKRKFRGCSSGRNKARAWPSNKGVHQHLLWTLPKCNITKWNHTPIKMLLINIQSIISCNYLRPTSQG